MKYILREKELQKKGKKKTFPVTMLIVIILGKIVLNLFIIGICKNVNVRNRDLGLKRRNRKSKFKKQLLFQRRVKNYLENLCLYYSVFPK